MPIDSEFKEFGARVPAYEYERFKDAFPQYGSTQWFINESLRQFNDLVARNPSLVDTVDKAVKNMLTANRNPEATAAMLGVSLNDLLEALKKQVREEGSDTVTLPTGTDGAKAR